MKKKNTETFVTLSWLGFIIAFSFMFIGLYTLEEPLMVKGYYAINTLFLVFSCFVLAKTIRDRQEEEDQSRRKDDM